MTTSDITAEPWMQQAKCTPYSADLWFDGPTGYAVSVCHRCPVRAQCLERTLEQEERFDRADIWGVAGGLTSEERRTIHKKKRLAERKLTIVPVAARNPAART